MRKPTRVVRITWPTTANNPIIPIVLSVIPRGRKLLTITPSQLPNTPYDNNIPTVWLNVMQSYNVPPCCKRSRSGGRICFWKFVLFLPRTRSCWWRRWRWGVGEACWGNIRWRGWREAQQPPPGAACSGQCRFEPQISCKILPLISPQHSLWQLTRLWCHSPREQEQVPPAWRGRCRACWLPGWYWWRWSSPPAGTSGWRSEAGRPWWSPRRFRSEWRRRGSWDNNGQYWAEAGGTNKPEQEKEIVFKDAVDAAKGCSQSDQTRDQ